MSSSAQGLGLNVMSEAISDDIRASAQALTNLMAGQLGAPVGLTTLVDEAGDRQVFIAAVGLPEPIATERQTPLSHSFCRIVKATNAPLIVTDSREDGRVHGNPAIEELGVISYLGYPLRAPSGNPLGSVCVIDTEPRQWTDREMDYVKSVAEAINTHINLQAALLEAEDSRKQLQAKNQELAEANRRFEDLARNVPGAIFRYVERSDGRSEIKFMSPGCEGIWELPPDRLTEDASPMWDMILSEDLPAMAASVRRSAETLTPWNHRWRIKTPSGRVKWLEGYGWPSEGVAGAVVWNSLILDVTKAALAEQKSAETMRLLYEAGKQETIGRLAGGIAHDFNNLLMVIAGSAEALLADGKDAEQVAFANSILKAANMGAELTKRLVSFARQSDLHPSRFDINTEVRNLRDLLRSVLPANIRLEIALAEGLPPIIADRSFLESSLLNLTLNARDAIDADGAITIETALVHVTEDFAHTRGETIVPGPYVMVAVTDTGEGMSSDVLARIFEPFFTTKPTDKGTGLGLPMVDGFVRQSGGMMRVYSEPGHGTSFQLYLPAFGGAALDNAKPVGDGHARSGPATVLLVEHQAEVRNALRTILTGSGHTVIEASSGHEALEAFRSSQYTIDVVVSDVVMPGRLQGPELVAELRKHSATMPVVYVSGYPHEANVHGNGIRRTDMTLIKPVSRDALRAAVDRALLSRRAQH